MDKQEIIKRLYGLNKIVNDCNLAYWKASDELQVKAQDNPTVLNMIQRANVTFSAGDPNGAKKEHFEIIKYLENPAPKMLDKELQVWYLNEKYGYPIYLCPLLIPSLLFNHQINDADYREMLDRIVSERLGNTIRSFLAGMWEPATLKRIHTPFSRKDGIYQLPHPNHLEEIENFINPAWKDMVVRRTKWKAERGITSIIDLIDDCSTHNYKNSHWGLHWMNPKNNNRNTHPKPGSCYHYEEYADFGRKAGEKSKTETEQYTVTGRILEAFYRYSIKMILDALPKNLHRFIGFGAGNEVRAGYFWHKRMDNKFMEQTPHFLRLTSMINPDFYKKRIHLHFNLCKHAIGTMKGYENARDNICHKTPGFLPSCDGKQFPSPDLVKKLTRQSLDDGNYGWELLTGIWDQNPPYDLSKLDMTFAKAMMEAFDNWQKL